MPQLTGPEQKILVKLLVAHLSDPSQLHQPLLHAGLGNLSNFAQKGTLDSMTTELVHALSSQYVILEFVESVLAGDFLKGHCPPIEAWLKSNRAYLLDIKTRTTVNVENSPQLVQHSEGEVKRVVPHNLKRSIAYAMTSLVLFALGLATIYAGLYTFSFGLMSVATTIIALPLLKTFRPRQTTLKSFAWAVAIGVIVFFALYTVFPAPMILKGHVTVDDKLIEKGTVALIVRGAQSQLYEIDKAKPGFFRFERAKDAVVANKVKLRIEAESPIRVADPVTLEVDIAKLDEVKVESSPPLQTYALSDLASHVITQLSNGEINETKKEFGKGRKLRVRLLLDGDIDDNFIRARFTEKRGDKNYKVDFDFLSTDDRFAGLVRGSEVQLEGRIKSDLIVLDLDSKNSVRIELFECKIIGENE